MITLFDGTEKIDSAKEISGISDGKHTFNELYDHRCLLFLMCLHAHPEDSWFSKAHEDGSVRDGRFIAGLDLPTGMITYHLPISMYGMAQNSGAEELKKGREWDGHTSNDVVNRLKTYMESY